MLIMSTIISIINKPKKTFGALFFGRSALQAAENNISVSMMSLHMSEEIFPGTGIGIFFFVKDFATALDWAHHLGGR